MRYRKLRIASSVVCGVVFILVAQLWGQTKHTSKDLFVGKLPYGVWISTRAGQINVSSLPDVDGERKRLSLPLAPRTQVPEYAGGSLSASELHIHDSMSTIFGDRTTYATVPIWMLGALVLALAAVPWIRWSARFSVRTLLIATTLVAVVLGLAIYAARK